MKAAFLLFRTLGGSALGAVWRFITANPWRTAALALGLIYVWQAHKIKVTAADLDRARNALAEEQSGRLADRQQWAAASELSAKIWGAALAAQRLQFQQERDKADEKAQQMVAGYAARADDYARRMRFSALCPATGGATGQSSGAQQGDAAQGSDGSGGDAIVLSRADFNILNRNTARLKAAHDWALGVEQ